MKLYFLVIILLFGVSGFNQVDKFHYFSEIQIGDLDYMYTYLEVDNGILISGKKNFSNAEEPVLLKLNTNGEVVWSTLNSTSLGYTDCNGFDFTLSEDGFIYAVSYNILIGDTFWKIDSDSGSVVWTTQFNLRDDYAISISDYDSLTYLIGYENQQNNPAIAKISKTTGDTIITKEFPEYYYGPGKVAIDDNQNVYYTTNGTLYKFNKDDFETPVWIKNHYKKITQLYLDDEDDIYIFGNNSSTSYGPGLFMKVSSLTGDILWTSGYATDVVLSDISDFKDFLHLTFRHSLVGSTNSSYTNLKINKTTGVHEWANHLEMDYLGNWSPSIVDHEAALSIDVDCAGNPYMTGYYGDSNYGPAIWGIMKAAGSTGNKVYDMTITEDSTYVDNKSEGRATCVFGNTAIFLGNEEYIPNQTKAMFVKMESDTIIQREYIGSTFQQFSRILDIISIDNEIITMKQKGKRLIIERFSEFGIPIWSTVFVDNGMLRGGRIKVLNNTVYVTAAKYAEDSIIPFYSSNPEMMKIYKLDALSGSELDEDFLYITGNTLDLFELEIVGDAAMVIYESDGAVNFCKWENSSFSAIHFLEYTTHDFSYNGQYNLVEQKAGGNLIYAGNSSLFEISTPNLTSTAVHSYGQSKDIYDLLIVNDTAFICGNNSSGNQNIAAININSMLNAWDYSTQINGIFYQIQYADSLNVLYVSSHKDSIAGISQISRLDGTIDWTYYLSNSNYSKTIPNKIKLIEDKGYIALTGASFNSTTNSDLIFDIVSTNGDSLFTYFEEDQLDKTSMGRALGVLSNNTLWFGGEINTFTHSKNGFIYSIVDSVWITDTTGVDNIGLENYSLIDDFLVYPNPVKNRLNISALDGDNFSIFIFDISGKLCYSKEKNSSAIIDLTFLNSGVYILKINKGEKSAFVKLIKYQN